MAILLAALALQLPACGEMPLTEDPRPWEKGKAVSDADMEEILKPDRPVESAGLYEGTDGRTYYVARLKRRPLFGYLKEYKKLIQSRGFLERPLTGSPHSFPPQIRGYEFLVFKKGRVKPYTLLYRLFGDGDPRWANRETLRNFPDPFTLDGDLLTVRLGSDALRPWQETILVPEEDVVQVRELPFPRYPGSVLARVSHMEREKDLLSDAVVGRRYATRRGSVEDVLNHYQKVINAHGIPIKRDPNQRNTLWWFGEKQAGEGGIEHIAVREIQIAPVNGRDLTVQQLEELVPSMFSDFPKDVITFSILVTFVDVESAAAYWTPSDQERRKALLTQNQENQ